MSLYLHKALCKGARGPKAGDQHGGDYLKRVQVGVDGAGNPKYRYLKTQDELAAYQAEQRQSGKDSEDGNKRLKEKLESERKDSKEKTGQNPSLITRKSLYVDLTWGTPDVPLLLGDRK